MAGPRYAMWDGEQWVPGSPPRPRVAVPWWVGGLLAMLVLLAAANVVYDVLGYQLGSKEWDLQRCTTQAEVTANGHPDVQVNLLQQCLNDTR